MRTIIFAIFFCLSNLFFISCKKESPVTIGVTPQPPPPPLPPPIPLVYSSFSPFTGGAFVGKLSAPKYDLSAIVCNNKFLFAGGLTNLYKAGDVVDIFDPLTNSSTTAKLSITRSDFSVTATATQAFFAGGYNANPESRIDIYNSLTNIWSTAELSEARYGIGAGSSHNKVCFAGGTNASGVSSTVDIYDTITNIWTTTKLSEARSNISAASIANKIIFAGGVGHNGPTKKVDIYTVSTNSWSTAQLSMPHKNLTSVVLNDKIYFAGENIMEVYDNTLNTWSTIPLPNSRNFIIPMAECNNKIAFIGGQTSQFNYSSQIEMYDPVTKQWSYSNMGKYQGMVFNGEALISFNNYIYSAGGSWFDGYFYEPVIADIIKFQL